MPAYIGAGVVKPSAATYQQSQKTQPSQRSNTPITLAKQAVNGKADEQRKEQIQDRFRNDQEKRQ